MFKRFINNIKKDYREFISARREIEELKKERQFWMSATSRWVKKYSEISTTSLDLINIQNALAKYCYESIV
jgi:hypothetical protein